MKSWSLTRAGASNSRAAPQSYLSRISHLSAILGCLVCMGASRRSLAADALPVPQGPIPTNSAAVKSHTPKGHSMLRYQAFAKQTALPTIAVAHPAALKVGDTVGIPLTLPIRLAPEQETALVKLLDVPAGVIANCFADLTNQPSQEPQELAQKLRVAVTDYRFLTAEWTKYQPQGKGQKVKARALELLKAGEIAEAWDLYDRLPRPAPPTVLTIVPR